MLTPHQCRLLYFIRDYLAQSNGVAPSFDTMAEGMGLKSKSGIHRILTALEDRGFIRRIHHRARAIEILHMPDGIDVLENLKRAARRVELEAGINIAVAVMADIAGEMVEREALTILPTTNAVGSA